MYGGARSLRALYVVMRILYVIHLGMGNQSSLSRTRVILLYFPDREVNWVQLAHLESI